MNALVLVSHSNNVRAAAMLTSASGVKYGKTVREQGNLCPKAAHQ